MAPAASPLGVVEGVVPGGVGGVKGPNPERVAGLAAGGWAAAGGAPATAGAPVAPGAEGCPGDPGGGAAPGAGPKGPAAA